MLLKFYAKADALQRVPSFHPAVGQPDRYVGRECKLENGAASFPATRDPFACDSESEDGRRLKHLLFRDGDLWAADQETADFCQVPFVAVEFDGGEWVPAKTCARAPAAAAPDKPKPSKDD